MGRHRDNTERMVWQIAPVYNLFVSLKTTDFRADVPEQLYVFSAPPKNQQKRKLTVEKLRFMVMDYSLFCILEIIS